MELARQMRGRTSWNGDYLEKAIPPLLLDKMIATDHWVDEEGFHWGFGRVFADLLDESPFVCVAQKAMGLGNYQLKAIFPPSTEITLIHR